MHAYISTFSFFWGGQVEGKKIDELDGKITRLIEEVHALRNKVG